MAMIMLIIMKIIRIQTIIKIMMMIRRGSSEDDDDDVDDNDIDTLFFLGSVSNKSVIIAITHEVKKWYVCPFGLNKQANKQTQIQ